MLPPLIDLTPTPRAPWHARWVAGVLLAGLAPLAQACQTHAIPLEQVKAPVDGKVVQAFGCKDAEGEQWFIESRAPGGTVNGKPQPTALSFYKFTVNPNGSLNKRWQARDFVAADSRLNRTARVDRFTARDVDGDGLAEAFIAYATPGQGANPDEGKLLVFFKDRKYAVRGAVAVMANGFSTRNLDPAFSTLPLSVRNHALSLWDSVAQPRGLFPNGGMTVTQAQEH